MSKYIYTTIYEQFTGLKPPEPKNHKPRRRRGYGHPYRMRLNMQEDGQPEELLDEDDMPEEQEPQTFLSPPIGRPEVCKPGIYRAPRPRHSSPIYSQTPRGVQSNPMMTEEPHKPESAPKVTYKKRRQYSEATVNPMLSE